MEEVAPEPADVDLDRPTHQERIEEPVGGDGTVVATGEVARRAPRSHEPLLQVGLLVVHVAQVAWSGQCTRYR